MCFLKAFLAIKAATVSHGPNVRSPVSLFSSLPFGATYYVSMSPVPLTECNGIAASEILTPGLHPHETHRKTRSRLGRILPAYFR